MSDFNTTPAELLAGLCQYRDDLRYPPAPDSIGRRLEMVEALIAKAHISTAAPDLLKALQWAIDEVDGGRLYERMCCDGRECGCQGSDNAAFLVHHLRETIAKARGL